MKLRKGALLYRKVDSCVSSRKIKYIVAACVAISLLAVLAYAEDKWTPSPLCPYPSEDLTRTPYEGDCTKYWECFEGARYVMSCPENTEYNEAEQRCDSPEIAKCDKDATVTYPTYPHTEDPDGTTSTTFQPDPMCPYPSSVLTFFPYPFNCSQYWECYNGKKYLMTCPDTTLWNTDWEYCDYPENVDCDKNAASTTTSTTAIPTTSGTGTVTNVTETTVSPTEPWTPDPMCPFPSEDLVFFPKPDNCSQYYECYEGNKYVMSCPNGLYWNDKAEVCDYPENVDCDRSPTTTTSLPTTTPISTNGTGTPSNGTTAPTTTTAVPTTTTTAAPTTPGITCFNTPDGTYFPDPKDCTRYYECVAGKGILMQCPSDLRWNQSKLTCDYPENVICRTT